MTMAASTPNPIHILRKVRGFFCCGCSSIAAKLLAFAPEILPQIRFDCSGVDAAKNRKRDPRLRRGRLAAKAPGSEDDDVLRIVRKPKRTGRIAYATMRKTQKRRRQKRLLHEFCALDFQNIVSISLTPPS